MLGCFPQEYLVIQFVGGWVGYGGRAAHDLQHISLVLTNRYACPESRMYPGWSILPDSAFYCPSLHFTAHQCISVLRAQHLRSDQWEIGDHQKT
jgi:hypothetical protein